MLWEKVVKLSAQIRPWSAVQWCSPPGAAVGQVVFDSETAEEEHEKGNPVILVRIETSPEDVGGMSAAEGILTSRGGMTSHAAVVARGWGKPCVAGCSDIMINYEAGSFTNGTITIHAGDWISIDGAHGTVIKGKKEVEAPTFDDNFHTFMRWVDEIRDMAVRTNADTPEDAAKAREYGAQGIGLARTEHMFFGDERIRAMRRMIISESERERRDALEQLLPYQKQDFMEIFEAMEGLPVTVRLLDPPLHEFLPEEDEEISTLAGELGMKEADLKRKIRLLSEFNPMLGHRGCRLGITYPEITEMQARALLEAAVGIKKKGKKVLPEIMIPLVGTSEEFIHQRHVVDDIADAVYCSKDGAPDTARKSNHTATAVANRADTVQCALDAGAIVAAELADAVDDVVDIFVRHFPLAQNHVTAGEACLGCTPEVHDYLDKVTMFINCVYSLTDARRQDREQRFYIIRNCLLYHD